MTQKRARQLSVLHVEDDEPTQHLRSEVLRRAGCLVSNVSTVRDATAAAVAKRPDVILCDVMLPDGNGFQMCREMRTLRPGVPIILISAVYRDEFAKQAAVFGGACEYLVEPVSPEDLVAAVRRQSE
jgi:two-component system, OmpR family, response regulator